METENFRTNRLAPSVQDLEAALSRAQAHFERVLATRNATEFSAAEKNLLKHERELAAAKGEEHAVPLEFPVPLGAGYPEPHIFSSERSTYLMFLVPDQHTGSDKTDAISIGPSAGRSERIALVHFKHCASIRMGSPNDEVHEGHPLHGKGLESYSAQEVLNSHWIVELERINSVHPLYRPERWRELRHFIFWFHDSTFECLAAEFSVEHFYGGWREMMKLVCERMVTKP